MFVILLIIAYTSIGSHNTVVSETSEYFCIKVVWRFCPLFSYCNNLTPVITSYDTFEELAFCCCFHLNWLCILAATDMVSFDCLLVGSTLWHFTYCLLVLDFKPNKTSYCFEYVQIFSPEVFSGSEKAVYLIVWNYSILN